MVWLFVTFNLILVILSFCAGVRQNESVGLFCRRLSFSVAPASFLSFYPFLFSLKMENGRCLILRLNFCMQS